MRPRIDALLSLITGAPLMVGEVARTLFPVPVLETYCQTVPLLMGTCPPVPTVVNPAIVTFGVGPVPLVTIIGLVPVTEVMSPTSGVKYSKAVAPEFTRTDWPAVPMASGSTKPPESIVKNVVVDAMAMFGSVKAVPVTVRV
jgi:hypothetical protein